MSKTKQELINMMNDLLSSHKEFEKKQEESKKEEPKLVEKKDKKKKMTFHEYRKQSNQRPRALIGPAGFKHGNKITK